MVPAQTFPAGEVGSSIEAPVAKGMVASSVAGVILLSLGFMIIIIIIGILS